MILIRYVIEKYINDTFCHGKVLLTNKDGRPVTFSTEESAKEWLIKNMNISADKVADYYNIKPHVV